MPEIKSSSVLTKFFSDALESLKDYKIKFLIDNDNEFDDVLGSFSDYDKELIVSDMSLENGLSVFIHEYSHFKQWIDGCPEYTKKYRGMDPTTVVDNWLNGQRYCDRTLDKCFRFVKELEFCCDKIAVEHIKSYKLPLDIDQYTISAIAYSHYYDYLRLTRHSPSACLYEHSSVLKVIKPNFESRNLDIIDPLIFKLIQKQVNKRGIK